MILKKSDGGRALVTLPEHVEGNIAKAKEEQWMFSVVISFGEKENSSIVVQFKDDDLIEVLSDNTIAEKIDNLSDAKRSFFGNEVVPFYKTKEEEGDFPVTDLHFYHRRLRGIAVQEIERSTGKIMSIKSDNEYILLWFACKIASNGYQINWDNDKSVDVIGKIN